MPVLIAKESCLQKKYGVEVSTIQLEGGVYTYRATVAGSADVALAAGAFSIVGRAKGAPTKIILASAPKLEASMVVNKNIKNLEDLKGKRIGIQEPAALPTCSAAACCAPPRSTPRTFTSSASPRKTFQPLVADQVDTAILHVEQEMVARSKVPSLHAVVRMWEIQPKNLSTVFAVTEKTIAEKRAALLAFTKANIEAVRLIYTDEAKVLPAVVKYTEQSKEVAKETLDFMIKNCIWDANSGIGPTSASTTLPN